MLHSYDDVTIIGEEVQSTMRVVFEQEGIFNVLHRSAVTLHRILIFYSLIPWAGTDHLFAS